MPHPHLVRRETAMDNKTTSCFLSKDQNQTILVMRAVMLSVSLLTNILAVAILVYFKSYKRFIFRLVLSLMVAHLFEVTFQFLELIPIDHFSYPISVRKGWEGVCAAFGFLDQTTMWMSNFVIIWLVMFICKLMKKNQDGRNIFTSDLTIAEVVGITICFLFPFTFNWIPLINGYYGLSEHWCWIKLTKSVINSTQGVMEDGSCGDITEGLIYMSIFSHGPLFVIVLVSSFISLLAIIAWCKNVPRSDSIKDMAIIIIYPVIFDLLCCILMANRFDSARRVYNGLEPNYPLWIAHSIADPARTLLPAVFFLLQLIPLNTRRMVTKTKYCDTSDEKKKLITTNKSDKNPLAETHAI